eukprot:Ihof_evm2s273 gene=Ihof_evmTU2s273
MLSVISHRVLRTVPPALALAGKLSKLSLSSVVGGFDETDIPYLNEGEVARFKLDSFRNIYKSHRLAYHRFPLSKISFECVDKKPGAYPVLIYENLRGLNHLSPFALVDFARLGPMGDKGMGFRTSADEEESLDNPREAYQDIGLSSSPLHVDESANLDIINYCGWLDEIEALFRRYMAENITLYTDIHQKYLNHDASNSRAALDNFIFVDSRHCVTKKRMVKPITAPDYKFNPIAVKRCIQARNKIYTLNPMPNRTILDDTDQEMFDEKTLSRKNITIYSRTGKATRRTEEDPVWQGDVVSCLIT